MAGHIALVGDVQVDCSVCGSDVQKQRRMFMYTPKSEEEFHVCGEG